MGICAQDFDLKVQSILTQWQKLQVFSRSWRVSTESPGDRHRLSVKLNCTIFSRNVLPYVQNILEELLGELLPLSHFWEPYALKILSRLWWMRCWVICRLRDPNYEKKNQCRIKCEIDSWKLGRCRFLLNIGNCSHLLPSVELKLKNSAQNLKLLSRTW